MAATSHHFSSHMACATVFFGVLAAAGVSTTASASPRLRCQLNHSGVLQIVDFTPVSNPYNVKAVDLNGRFRFKAVVVGDEQKIDYISLYTYYQSKRQPVLLHQAKYLSPVADVAPNPTALTGTNYVHSPDLEREFQYACAVYEVAQ